MFGGAGALGTAAVRTLPATRRLCLSPLTAGRQNERRIALSCLSPVSWPRRPTAAVPTRGPPGWAARNPARLPLQPALHAAPCPHVLLGGVDTVPPESNSKSESVELHTWHLGSPQTEQRSWPGYAGADGTPRHWAAAQPGPGRPAREVLRAWSSHAGLPGEGGLAPPGPPPKGSNQTSPRHSSKLHFITAWEKCGGLKPITISVTSMRLQGLAAQACRRAESLPAPSGQQGRVGRPTCRVWALDARGSREAGGAQP